MVKFCYKIVIRIGDVMKKGFTLIELLAVITIMGLLAVIMIPKILERVDNDNQKVDEAKVSLIKSAADTYISKNINDYPNTLNNADAISANSIREKNSLSSAWEMRGSLSRTVLVCASATIYMSKLISSCLYCSSILSIICFPFIVDPP